MKAFMSVCACCISLMLLVASPALGITYNGSSTIGEELMPKFASAFGSESGIRFGNIGTEGSEKGLKLLSEKKTDIAGVSRALTAEEQAKGFFVHVLGYDAIGIYVNKEMSALNLSKNQIKMIFSGKIKNWKEVGGPDAPIEVVTEIIQGNRATIKVFREMILEGEQYGETKQVDAPHACVRYVAHNKNAITFASTTFTEPGSAMLSIDKVAPTSDNIASQKYVLSRPLLLLTQNPPQPEVKKFLDFVSSQKGKDIIRKYFIPAK